MPFSVLGPLGFLGSRSSLHRQRQLRLVFRNLSVTSAPLSHLLLRLLGASLALVVALGHLDSPGQPPCLRPCIPSHEVLFAMGGDKGSGN